MPGVPQFRTDFFRNFVPRIARHCCAVHGEYPASVQGGTGDSAADKRRAENDSLGVLAEPSVVSVGLSPEGQIPSEEERRLLGEAIGQLTPKCRAAFTLRVFQLCSFREIALRLGMTPKAVENHIGRALRETHEYLRNRCRLGTDHGRHSPSAER